MKDFELACTVQQLVADRIRVLARPAGNVLLCYGDGKVHAFEDRCPHEDVPLSKGCLVGNAIRCALHGSRFDLDSGMPLEEPAETPLVRYPVRVEKDRVWVAAHPAVDDPATHP